MMENATQIMLLSSTANAREQFQVYPDVVISRANQTIVDTCLASPLLFTKSLNASLLSGSNEEHYPPQPWHQAALPLLTSVTPSLLLG